MITLFIIACLVISFRILGILTKLWLKIALFGVEMLVFLGILFALIL